MTQSSRFSCVLMGGQSLLIQCAEILLDQGHSLTAVVSHEPQIQSWARDRGVEVLEPVKGWDQEILSRSFDYFFSIANLSMVPERVLDHASRRSINFHDGPLPRYAGLNAPAWALWNGEARYGISWHVMTAAADEGDLLKQREFELQAGDTSLTLNTRCYEAAIGSFEELVEELATGTEQATPQDLSQRTYFEKHRRPEAAGLIRWHEEGEVIARHIRALDYGTYANPLGVARFLVGEDIVLVQSVELLSEESPGQAGEVLDLSDGKVRVGTQSHPLLLSDLRRPDGTPITELDELGLSVGDRLTEPEDCLLKALDSLCASYGRYEEFWQMRLLRAVPLELPYAQRNQGESSSPQWQRLESAHSQELVQ